MIAKIYFNRLLTGSIDFKDIPEKYQNEVRQYGLQWIQQGKLNQEDFLKLVDDEI